MGKRSNVVFNSNIYEIKSDFRRDKKFQSKVRGRENLRKMLVILSGQDWVKDAHPNVDRFVNEFLTDIQKEEWDLGKPCEHPILKQREMQWGQIKTETGIKITCRCYETNCPQYSACRPNVSDPQIIKPENQVFSEQEEVDIAEVPVPEEIPEVEEDQPGKNDDQEIEIKFDQEDIFLGEINMEFLEKEDLANNQEEVIRANPKEGILVQAGPGTGKTFSLLKKLEYLIDEEELVEAEGVLVLCFTRAAVQEIKNRFRKGIKENRFSDDLSRLEIRTFDSFATRLLIACEKNVTGKDYDERIEMAIKEIKQQPEILDEMKHLIVDEIQDLVGVRARFVETLLKNKPEIAGFTLLGDSLQGIYDYQIEEKPWEKNAINLLTWVENYFSDYLKKVEFKENLRQKPKLREISQKARELVKRKNEDDLKTFLCDIEKLPYRGEDYQFSLPELSQGKRIAVLCRTNGEALKISGLLRDRNEEHNLLTREKEWLLPVWVGKILQQDYPAITMEKFQEALKKDLSKIFYSAQDVFYAFQSLEGKGPQRIIDLNSVRRKLAEGARLPDEFYNIEDYSHSFFVSTIHKAKGREFDVVFLIPPDKNYVENNLKGKNLFEEAKVFYVGITRAKDELNRIGKSRSRNVLKKARADRWLEKSSRRGKESLISIEVGLKKDFDDQSFIDPEIVEDFCFNQRYILNNIKVGDKVTLELIEDGKCHYKISHNGRFIGRMSEEFLNSVKEIMLEVYNSPSYLPTKLEDLYINKVHTVIKREETLRPILPEVFLDKGVWFGVRLGGLGRVRWPWD